MKQNENLKYIKKYADAVLKETKRYEIRKASKGYTSGRKNLISLNKKTIYGSAHYKLIGANNDMHKDSVGYWLKQANGVFVNFDEATYNFAKENYIDKGIDYVVFDISEPKVHNG